MKISNLAMFLVIFMIIMSLIEFTIAKSGFAWDMTAHAISGFMALALIVAYRREINDINKKIDDIDKKYDKIN